MCGRVVVAKDAVAGGRENLAVAHHDRAERAAGLVDDAGLTHEADRLAHVLAILVRNRFRGERLRGDAARSSHCGGHQSRAGGEKVTALHHARRRK
jgi:hypothetical protein